MDEIGTTPVLAPVVPTPEDTDVLYLPDTVQIRTHSKLNLYIGPSKSKFRVESILLDRNSLYFRQRPKVHSFEFPQLTLHGVKIALDILQHFDQGVLRQTADEDVLNNCYDVYNVAREWDLPFVRAYVEEVLGADTILDDIQEHELFLNQLYQMYNILRKHGGDSFRTLEKCVNTVKFEHDTISDSFPTQLHRYNITPLTPTDLMFNALMTEVDDDHYKYCVFKGDAEELDLWVLGTDSNIWIGNSRLESYLRPRRISWILLYMLLLHGYSNGGIVDIRDHPERVFSRTNDIVPPLATAFSTILPCAIRSISGVCRQEMGYTNDQGAPTEIKEAEEGIITG
ncbi:hypothetical protein ABW19_dt0210485 [Dactylella cylindrospora]|nr:hypothetical protein ABW19_dt0210485 [Dactylella cylindrospora]